MIGQEPQNFPVCPERSRNARLMSRSRNSTERCEMSLEQTQSQICPCYTVDVLSTALGVKFSFEGRRYTLRDSDASVQRFLDQLMVHQREQLQQGSSSSLFPFRDDFRRIAHHAPIGGLVSFIRDRRGDARRIAIWLLGRIHCRYTVHAIQYAQHDADHRVRKEVATALRRLGAWE